MPNDFQTPSSLAELSKAVTDFLQSPQPSTKELMSDIVRPLQAFGEVVIIGGLVRDIAFYGPDRRPISDVDLVICSRRTDVRRFAERIGAMPNRFGGFGIRTHAFKVDFWALSTTWAKTHRHVPVRRSTDLLRCTFFDWDAVLYTTDKRRVFAIPRYLDRMRRRVLDLNLLPNPSVKGNLIRALRRLIMWDVRPGKRLQQFIQDALHRYEWAELAQTERRAFDITVLDRFEHALEFTEQILHNPYFSGVGRDDLRDALFPSMSLDHQYAWKKMPPDLSFSHVRPRIVRRRQPKALKDFFE
jgi:hypothetical protein